MGRTGWAVAATALALLVVVGQVSSVGPVVLSVTPRHGLHAGDAVVLGLWVLTMAWLARGARAARSRADLRP